MTPIEASEDGRGFIVRLRDGRRIGCAEYGDPAGRPLVWFPGTPGSRLASPPDESLTRARRVRYIAIERPGFGTSDPAPGRTILDWTRDFADVLDALALDRVALAGTSGAGPFLCACAHSVPERLGAVALIGAIAPPEREVLASLPAWRRAAFASFRHAPGAVRLVVAQTLRTRGVDGFYASMVRDAAPRDRIVLARIMDRQLAMTREALRKGPEAFVWETHLAASPWGFSLANIRVPVFVFQGSEDRAAPVAMGRFFARTIPGCVMREFPGEGHFLHHDHWPEILDSLGFGPRGDRL